MLSSKLKGVLRWSMVTVGIVVLTSFTVDATLNNTPSQSALGIIARDITESDCPRGTVRIENSDRSFCIDLYEATAGESCEHGTLRTDDDTQANLDEPACKPASVAGSVPWTHVTYHQAQELCARKGMRLPTHEEWYKAAIGTPDPKNGGYCNMEGGSLKETGSHEACHSPGGVYDMLGNAWEWIDADASDGVYDGRTLPNTGYVVDADAAGVALATSDVDAGNFHEDYFWSNNSGSFGMIRGGFYNSESDGGLYSIQSQVTRSFSGAAIGFRCVADV